MSEQAPPEELIQPEEWMTMGDAAKKLGVSRTTLRDLVKRGVITQVRDDPLDRRLKLVRRAEIDHLASQSTKKDAV
jgi:excisionase family DNA binding protein